jgi:hypothetical protein
MNAPFPPSPFPVKGAIPVQPHCGFRFVDLLPPWGGPTEAAK